MDTTTTEVFKAIADLTRLSTEVGPLTAIWLDKPLQTARKRTLRIANGDMVRVDATNVYNDPTFTSPYLINCGEHYGPTHIIIECLGTIYGGKLQVICEDLDTQELITVKL